MTTDHDLADGRLARSGQLDVAAAQAVLDRVERDKIETIRILFTDPHGVLRGKTVTAAALPSVFRSGLGAPSTLLLKDTAGRTVFPVWSEDAGLGGGALQGAGDMLMIPDPATFRVLPWSGHSAWILCDLAYSDGGPWISPRARSCARPSTGLAPRGGRHASALRSSFICSP